MIINWKKIWSAIDYWVAELFVIFIGVYLAFSLNGYRIQQQDNHKKQQIYSALYRYFSDVAPDLKKAYTKSDSTFLTPFLKSYRKGDMPRLKKSNFIRSSYNDNTWNAMLQAGGINLLKVKFIQEISNYFGMNQVLTEESSHFNHMQDKYLLPNYDSKLSVFYNTHTKKLRPKFEWYVNSLKRLQKNLQFISKQSQQILKTLKNKMSKQQLRKLKTDPATKN